MPSEDDGLENARRTVLAFREAPLHLLAAQEGKAVRAWLSEWTGLSPARISKGNLDQLRQSTLDRVEERSRKKIKRDAGWSDDEIDGHQRSVRLENGEIGSWASWVTSVAAEPASEIPYTLDLALSVDDLLQKLALALSAGDAKTACTAMCRCIEIPKWSELVPDMGYEPGSLSQATFDYGEDVGATVSMLLEERLFDLFSALDAEWGGEFFGKLRPEPIFLWIAPRVHPDLVPGQPPKTKRNMLFRPIRRLLEISHALACWVDKKEWPQSAAGPAEISQACAWDEAGIVNLFDGTRKLTLKSYVSLWNGLFAEVARRNGVPAVACPLPLAAMAIAFQRLLVQTAGEHKWRSFIVLDERKYKKLWNRHREKLAGQRLPGEEGWPAWLINQSLESDSMRSSQSSGRSSSPRECQYSS